jgi:hypothetical protein
MLDETAAVTRGVSSPWTDLLELILARRRLLSFFLIDLPSLD